MKKLSLAVSIFALLITACSEDEDTEPNTTTSTSNTSSTSTTSSTATSSTTSTTNTSTTSTVGTSSSTSGTSTNNDAEITKLETELDQAVETMMTQKSFPGTSVLLLKGEDILYSKGYGRANIASDKAVDENTIFMLGSVSKTMTATALMKLVQDGQVDLKKSINDYLPFKIQHHYFPNDIITVEMLLTHTTGFNEDNRTASYYTQSGDPGTDLALEIVMKDYFLPSGQDYQPLNFDNRKPGIGVEYCNMNTALMGYLVESVTKTKFNEWCKTNLFSPLCMKNTGWLLKDISDQSLIATPYVNNAPIAHIGFGDYPNGLLRASTNDLANYLAMYIQSFTPNQILNSNTLSNITTQRYEDNGEGVGYHWFKNTINGVDYWTHAGAEQGASTYIFFSPTTKIGGIILANGDEGAGGNHFDNVITKLIALADVSNKSIRKVGCN